MKRDIIINYGKIEEIVYELTKYEKSLTTMKATANNIKKNLEKSESKAVTALLDNFKVANDDITTCQKEIKGINKILKSYVSDMSEYARAIHRGNRLRIDRNDIWWNMKSINSSYSSLYAREYFSDYYGSRSDNDEDIANEEYNASEIEYIKNEVKRTANRLDAYMDELWQIYNKKIVPFENTDDEYRRKAWKLYWNYTGFTDWFQDFFSSLAEGIGNIVSGAIDAIVDMIKGFAQLITGVINYLGSGIVILVSSPFGDTPDWAQEAHEYFDDTNAMIGSLLDDPIVILEGIAQGASDSVETKGICYGTGYIIGSVIGVKGIDKASKVAKGGLTGLTKGKMAINSIDDLIKYGCSSDDLALIGVNNADDIARLGLNSVDDVAALEAKVSELVKGASGAVDDVVKKVPKTKPEQLHHYATDKSKTYTLSFKDITNKYDLDLNNNWNKELLPHQGRHTNAYHDFVLNKMREIDNIAKGNKDIFLDLYESEIKSIVRETPDMLYSDFWKNLK